MCGLIWLIQLVHYPSFSFIDQDRYREFQRFHMFKIAWIVFPIMTVELASGALLLAKHPGLTWSVNLGLLTLIWLSTAFIQTPIHSKLERGFDAQLIRTLVRGNWLRTALWHVRSILVSISLTSALT
ncbi:MAG: hypothetical protein KDD64_14735 [Bdellovibrionales bacterium]|nr:hypothetical protein [Bdellovibrionales bacterium]